MTAAEDKQALLAKADGLRDARRWAEAATAYQVVLQRDPHIASIWVQLGHALKESGQPGEAEAAYRRSILLAPDVADTHLQLAHVLKLTGRREEALESYARALRVDPDCRPALQELIALGEGWRAERETGSGQRALQQSMSVVEEMRRSLARIEAQLPSVASLVSFTLERYDLFRRTHTVPPPPKGKTAPKPKFLVLVLDNGGNFANVIDLCGSLRRQDGLPSRIALITTNPNNATAFDRVRRGLAFGTEPAILAPAADWRASIFALSKSAATDWVLLTTIDTVLAPTALSWFAFAASETAAVALYADEDRLTRGDADEDYFAKPFLKTAFDPEFVDQRGNYGSTLALRRDSLEAGIAETSSVAIQSLLDDLLARAADGHGVGHIPRVLTSRVGTAETGVSGIGARAMPPIATTPQATQNERIRVIIPTRNDHEILRQCVDSLLATARARMGMELIVVDNGSDEAETIAYIEAGARQALFAVLRVDEPFNWSRLNNLAIGDSQTDLLVFANNDIEMLTQGWDDILRDQLRRESVGVVGVKLVYPDGTLQHAGIVLGANRRTEHEGVGAAPTAQGSCGRWHLRRRAAAVTGAFLACRRTDFQALGGFDEIELPILFNDIDFCLRMRQQGLQILFEPAIIARHHESKTLRLAYSEETRAHYTVHALCVMRQRWGDAFRRDPGFNPHFSRWGRPFETLSEPSMDVILDHLFCSARANPWLVDA